MQTIIAFLGGLMLGITIVYPQVSKAENESKTYEFSLQVCQNQLESLKSEQRGMLMNKD